MLYYNHNWEIENARYPGLPQPPRHHEALHPSQKQLAQEPLQDPREKEQALQPRSREEER